MGFFDFFRKKKLSHTEKAAAACQSCGPEAAERWFLGGPEEAADILSSLANICQVDLDRCGVREYGQLLRAYTDLADRETEGKPEDGGTAKEPAEFSNPFVRTPKTAREVLEYTAIHLRDRSFSVSGEEELRFLRGRVAAAEKQSRPGEHLELCFYFETAAEWLTCWRLLGERPISWQQGDAYLERYRRGRRFMEEGRFRWAIQTLRGSLCLNPVGISARFALCECYFRLKECSSARRCLNETARFLTASGEIARFYRQMGHIEYEGGNYLGAMACYAYSLKFADDSAVEGTLEQIRVHMGEAGDQVCRDPVSVLKRRNITVLKTDKRG